MHLNVNVIEDQKFYTTEPDKERQYGVPVQEDIKEWVPKSIPEMQQFIEKMLPNIHSALVVRGATGDDIDTIAAEFILYMLRPSNSGKPRFLSYRNDKNIPFYKWFLSYVQYFVLQDYKRKRKESRIRTVTMVSDFEAENGENSLFVVAERNVNVQCLDLADLTHIKELPIFLQKWAQKHPRTDTPLKKHFENHIYDLYESRMSGEQNQVFAAKKGVSPSTVSQWMEKLKDIVSCYLRGQEPAMS